MQLRGTWSAAGSDRRSGLGNTGRHIWRNPSDDTAWYLRNLQYWGYTLCPVERIAAMLDTE